MSQKRVYAVVTSKDNFLTNILNEDEAIELGKSEGSLEPNYVKKINGNVLVLENVTMLVPEGQGLGILPFHKLPFGSEYVTVAVPAITEIYLVSENLATKVRAAVAGLELSK